MVKLRAGVIGCGNIGAFPGNLMRRIAPPHFRPLSHIDAVSSHEGISLECVCDPDPSKLSAVEKIHPDLACFDNLDDMLETDLQIITLATRTKGRADIIRKVVDAGVPFLHIEKPLCNSVEELTDLMGLFQSSGACFTYGTMRRFISPYKHLKRKLDENYFGNCSEVIVSFGKGLLIWTHAHSIDLLNYFAFPAVPVFVSAKLLDIVYGEDENEVVNDPYVEHLVLEYSNGMKGVISTGAGMELTINCEKGKVCSKSDGGEIVFRSSKNDDPYFQLREDIFEDSQKYEGIAAPINVLYESFVGKLQNKDELWSSMRSAFSGMEIIFSAIESNRRSGQYVQIGDYSKKLYLHGKFGDRHA